MEFSSFPGGDTQKSWAQTKFEAKPVKISPFRTARIIGRKIAPPPKSLFPKGNWKFGRWQSADIKQAAELDKFQIRPTPGPIVTGLRTFGPCCIANVVHISQPGANRYKRGRTPFGKQRRQETVRVKTCKL